MSSCSWLLQRFGERTRDTLCRAAWRPSGGRFGRRCASLAGSHRRNLAKKKRMQRGEATTFPLLAGRTPRRRFGSGCRGEYRECKRRTLRGADSGLSHDGLHCEPRSNTGNHRQSASARSAASAGEIPTHTTYPLPSLRHCARSTWRGLLRRETTRCRSRGDFRKVAASLVRLPDTLPRLASSATVAPGLPRSRFPNLEAGQ